MEIDPALIIQISILYKKYNHVNVVTDNVIGFILLRKRRCFAKLKNYLNYEQRNGNFEITLE